MPNPALPTPADDLQSVDDRKTAKILDISTRTLRRLDAAGEGPAYFRIGRLKRRTVQTIRAWMRNRENPQAA